MKITIEVELEHVATIDDLRRILEALRDEPSVKSARVKIKLQEEE